MINKILNASSPPPLPSSQPWLYYLPPHLVQGWGGGTQEGGAASLSSLSVLFLQLALLQGKCCSVSHGHVTSHTHHRRQSTMSVSSSCGGLPLGSVLPVLNWPGANVSQSHSLFQDPRLSATWAFASWASFCLSAAQVSLSGSLPVLSESCRVSACQLATAQREMALPTCLPNLLLTYLCDCMVVSSALLPPNQMSVPKRDHTSSPIPHCWNRTKS